MSKGRHRIDRRGAPSRQVAGQARTGKQDRADAVKKILEDLIAELAPNPTDPNASYMSIVEAKNKQKTIRNVFGEVEEQPQAGVRTKQVAA